MVNRFARAAARLQQRLGSHAAVDIIYSRGEQSIATTASVGKTPFTSQTEGGLTITDEHRDYLVLSADLASFWPVAGGKAEPQAGDQVRETLDGVTAVFEVMSPGDEPVFTRPGTAGGQLRIHTKRFGTE